MEDESNKGSSNLPVPVSSPKRMPVIRRRSAPLQKPPQHCNIVIFNTARLPKEELKGLLMAVFSDSARDAGFHAWFQPHIPKGPYTREAAETKMRQVRDFAVEVSMPIPHMRRYPV